MPIESEFPANSHKAKETPAKGKDDERKVESVVTGKVVQRKKPLRKRFAETFFGGGNSKDVGSYVLFDVLIPAAQDMIMDATVGGLERKFDPDGRRSSSRRGRSSSARRPADRAHIPYNRMSDPRGRAGSSDGPREMSRRGRAIHDFEEIILDSRHEADTVIERLYDILDKFDTVTVADLYDLCDISGSFTDDKYGWTDLSGTRAVKVRDGYLIDVPRPEPLN
jgi:hypothetical protein